MSQDIQTAVSVDEIKELVALYNSTYKLRSEYKVKVDTLTKELERLKAQIIVGLNQNGLEEGMVADNYKFSVDERERYAVTDWDRFFEYVKDNNAWWLVGKKIKSSVVDEEIKRLPFIRTDKVYELKRNKN